MSSRAGSGRRFLILWHSLQVGNPLSDAFLSPPFPPAAGTGRSDVGDSLGLVPTRTAMPFGRHKSAEWHFGVCPKKPFPARNATKKQPSRVAGRLCADGRTCARQWGGMTLTESRDRPSRRATRTCWRGFSLSWLSCCQKRQLCHKTSIFGRPAASQVTPPQPLCPQGDEFPRESRPGEEQSCAQRPAAVPVPLPPAVLLSLPTWRCPHDVCWGLDL